MSATLCPACNRPLPASVVNGPAQAVVRCEGCQTLLLWSNGRVMRSAKSSTPTMMGMQAVTAKPGAPAPREADAPLPELRPEADAPVPKAPTPPRAATPAAARPAASRPTMVGIGENVPTRVAPPSPELRKEATRKDGAPAPVKNAPSGPIKTGAPPSAAAKVPPSGPIKTGAAPSAPAKVPPSGPIKTGAAPSAPAKVPPSGPIKTAAAPSAPAKAAPSGPTKLPPPAKPATPPTSDAAKSESPHVVAAVAQVPKMTGGDMVDPSAWFQGDVSEVVPPEKLPPVESTRAPQGETTGAQPLPPPPELPSLPPLEVEPFEIEPPPSDKTPPIGTRLPDLDSAPIAVSAREPSQKIAAREPSQKIAAREPSPKPPAEPAAAKKSANAIRGGDPQVPPPARAVSELPSAGTSIGKPREASPRATVMGRPALEVPPKPAEPVAAAIDLLPPAKTPAASTSPATATAPSTSAPSATVPSANPPATSAPSPAAPAPMSPSMGEPAVAADEPSPATLPAAAEVTNQPLLPMQPETTRVPREISRRTLFIVGGAASGVILLVVMVIALAHGGKTPPAKQIAPVPPVATAPTPPAAPPTPAPEPTPTAAPPAPEPTEAAAPAPPRPRRTLGGKKVVLEYDPKPTSPTPPPPQAPTPMGEDPATVARAREAYHNGNVKLFAGDDDGAIALYRESLKIYPGYVAGYRGLGLAFEEAGRKSDALTAFHTYVRTVPNAVDAPIIRRRIEHLESEK